MEEKYGFVAAILRHHRAGDGEFQALTCVAEACVSLDSTVPSNCVGDLWMHVSEVCCVSCCGAMVQFKNLFPHVNLHVSYDLGRQTGTDWIRIDGPDSSASHVNTGGKKFEGNGYNHVQADGVQSPQFDGHNAQQVDQISQFQKPRDINQFQEVHQSSRETNQFQKPREINQFQQSHQSNQFQNPHETNQFQQSNQINQFLQSNQTNHFPPPQQNTCNQFLQPQNATCSAPSSQPQNLDEKENWHVQISHDEPNPILGCVHWTSNDPHVLWNGMATIPGEKTQVTWNTQEFSGGWSPGNVMWNRADFQPVNNQSVTWKVDRGCRNDPNLNVSMSDPPVVWRSADGKMCS